MQLRSPMTDHRTTHATVAVSPCVTSLVARSYQVLTFYSCQTVVFVLFQGWQKYILHTSAGCVRQPGSSILASYHRWSVQPVAFVALYSKICCAIACWNHWVRWRIKTVTNHCEKKVSSDTKMMNRDVCSDMRKWFENTLIMNVIYILKIMRSIKIMSCGM